MKISRRYLPIVLLSLALMVLIFIAQLLTNQATLALKQGNLQAVETFKINNRMQELVNLAFDLQSKLRPSFMANSRRAKSLGDSLTLLEYNSNALMRAAADDRTSLFLEKINGHIISQVNLSFQALEAGSNEALQIKLLDSLRKQQLGDSIYTNCLEVQKQLEKDLQETLITNTAQANKLSLYNRILAIAAIVAILIMTTIIVIRHARQLQLISELKQAQKAAQRSTEAKDQFLANMSHELRTPLNALVGFGQLLSQTPLNEEQRQYAGIISSAGYNLLNIVNDVLDISKIEAGKLRIEKRVFELRELLRDIQLMFSATLTEKGLAYISEVDEKLPRFLKSDPERLKQILTNLVSNAIKFTQGGTVQVSVSVTGELPYDRLRVSFSVSDTGAGIPPDKLSTIFQRFEQLGHATTRQHGGTGLGLTIVKSLVDMLEGTISVKSEPGNGSVFSFSLPFEKVNGKAGDIRKQQVLPLKEKPWLAGYRVLAVEDNKTNQLLLGHLLERYGTVPEFAANGEEAIRLLTANSYDLVLMDIQMPVMDGYATARHIRREMQLQVPMIAITAYVSREEAGKCLAAGFDAYVSKPLEEHKLLESIRIFLPGKAQASPTAGKQAGKNEYLLQAVNGDEEKAERLSEAMREQWLHDKKELMAAGEDQQAAAKVLHRLRSTFSPLGPDHIVFRRLAEIEKEIAMNGINAKLSVEFVTRLERALSL